MSKHEEMQTEFGPAYNLYGIYIDWRIDRNFYLAKDYYDPNGIRNFEDFFESCQWQVAKVIIAGSERLIIDIDLERFNYCKMTKLEKTVIEENIAGKEILQLLKEWGDETGLVPLDQMTYYLSGGVEYNVS